MISNFRKLADALAGKDTQLAQFVDANNAVFQAFAAQEANIRATLQELPPSLTQTQSTLAKVNTLANTVGPTFQALLPAARALAPAQLATRPFFKEATPILKNEIRPFTRTAQPIVKQLRPAVKDLTALTPDLVQTFKVLNYALNELGYNPSGSEEGFLYWLGWFPHVLGGLYTTGDAHGAIRRGEILLSCTSLALVEGVGAGIPAVGLISGLSHIPTLAEVCATPAAGAAARKAAPSSGKDKPSDNGLGPAGEGPNATGTNGQGTGSGASGQGTSTPGHHHPGHHRPAAYPGTGADRQARAERGRPVAARVGLVHHAGLGGWTLEMQKQAPTVGQLLVMVAFALSCVGLILFLWLTFGGSIPLAAKGYRVTVPLREASQLATEADVRISGVSVGKVK